MKGQNLTWASKSSLLFDRLFLRSRLSIRCLIDWKRNNHPLQYLFLIPIKMFSFTSVVIRIKILLAGFNLALTSLKVGLQ